jgi:hypothetical protein
VFYFTTFWHFKHASSFLLFRIVPLTEPHAVDTTSPVDLSPDALRHADTLPNDASKDAGANGYAVEHYAAANSAPGDAFYHDGPDGNCHCRSDPATGADSASDNSSCPDAHTFSASCGAAVCHPDNRHADDDVRAVVCNAYSVGSAVAASVLRTSAVWSGHTATVPHARSIEPPHRPTKLRLSGAICHAPPFLRRHPGSTRDARSESGAESRDDIETGGNTC